MKNILIIGCGLLGSSLVRRISKKKIAKKIFVYEKSKKNILKIKKLKLPGIIKKSLKDGVIKSDFIIFCTPMSQYKGLILRINKFILPNTLITDVGSSKIETSKIIKKFLRKDIHWIQSSGNTFNFNAPITVLEDESFKFQINSLSTSTCPTGSKEVNLNIKKNILNITLFQ